MAGELFLIALGEEIDLVVLLPQGFVEVVHLLNEGLLDQLRQSPHVGDAVLCFSDQPRPCRPCVFFVVDVSVSELVLEPCCEFLQSLYFGILLTLDVLQLGSQCALYCFLKRDGGLQFADLPLQFLLDVSVLPLYALEFLGEGFLESLALLLTLVGALRSQLLLLVSEVLTTLLLGLELSP